ncbi:MAG: glycosyltransferase [Proteobacteria bacterium]|nr:glycosyltransferase [Pseudomonadota bacterium]
MRILNIDGGYFIRVLREMGHEVLSVGREGCCDLVLDEVASLRRLMEFLESRAFRPDLVLWADNCRPPSVIGFESLPAPCIGFSIDQYCNPWHLPFSAAFDLMLVAQKDYRDMFQHRDLPRPVQWFPLFCNLAKDVDLGAERDIPVSFVGTLSGSINKGRMDFLNAFKRFQPVFLHQGLYPPVYGRSRIVVNQSAAGEINFRTFEAAACGAAVLTEDIANGQAEIFTPGETVLTYPRGDAEAAARVAREWLARPEDLARVARAGRDLVLAEHSDRVRAQEIIRHAERLTSKHSWKWRFENQGIVRGELAKMFTMLGSDWELPIPLALRDCYVRLAGRYLSAQ